MPASAAFADPTETDRRVAAYLWAPSFEATYGFPGQPPVDGGGTSLIDILEGGVLLKAELRADTHIWLGELNYLRLGDALDSGVPAIGAELGLTGLMGALSYGVPVYRSDRFDLYATAGLRAWDVELSAKISPGPLAPARSEAWVDPIIGGAFHWAASDRLSVVAEASVGGFGVGSQLQSDIAISARWALNDRWDAALGYRDLRVDFDSGGFVADMTITGPTLDIGYRF